MPGQNIIDSVPSFPVNAATEIGSYEQNGVGRAIINITNGENVFVEGNSDFKLSFGHSDKSSGHLQAAVEDLHTKRDEVLESIVNRQETLPPAACQSSTLIARSDSNAIDLLFNSISDSGKNVEFRERFNHADAAVRIAVTDLAALILEVRESGGGLDKYNSLNQRLCALIQKDKLGDRSGFAASYVGNVYDEVNKLRSDVAKELTPLLGSEKLFDVVVTRDAMQEIRKNVEEKYGPQHLATWEKINDAKGLISSAATETLGRLLEASSKNAEQRDLMFVDLANQRRLALHLPELNRPTEETAKPDPVKKGPAPTPSPAPERGPHAGNPAMWPPNSAPVQNANPNINFSPVISIRIPETNGHRTTERSDQESPTSHKTESNRGSDVPQKLNIERGKIDPELGRSQSHLSDVSVPVANGILSNDDIWLTPTQAPRLETTNAVATEVPKTTPESVDTLQDDIDGSDSESDSDFDSGPDATPSVNFAAVDDDAWDTSAEDELPFGARSESSFDDRTGPTAISSTVNATPETRQSSEDVVDPHIHNAAQRTGTPAGNGASDFSDPNGPNGPSDSDTQFQQILKKFQRLKGVPKGRPLTGAPDFVWGKVDQLSTSDRPVLIDVKAPDPNRSARDPITLRRVISQDAQGTRYEEVQPSLRFSNSEQPFLVGPDKW